MIDDSAHALNQDELSNSTLLYLQLQLMTRERDAMRDLLNEATMILVGIREPETWMQRTLRVLSGDFSK